MEAAYVRVLKVEKFKAPSLEKNRERAGERTSFRLGRNWKSSSATRFRASHRRVPWRVFTAAKTAGGRNAMKRTVRLSLRARVWGTRGVYKTSTTKCDRNDELFIVFVVSLQLHYNYITIITITLTITITILFIVIVSLTITITICPKYYYLIYCFIYNTTLSKKKLSYLLLAAQLSYVQSAKLGSFILTFILNGIWKSKKI